MLSHAKAHRLSDYDYDYDYDYDNDNDANCTCLPFNPQEIPVPPAIDTAPPLPDLSQCEAEPIHIPGSIQPHGVLLALHGPTLRITQASTSTQALLGVAAQDLLGRDLATALDPALAAALGEARARDLDQVAPAAFDWQPPGGGQVFVGYVHESGPLTVLELEPAPAAPPALGDTLARAVERFSEVRAQPDLPTKLQRAAALFRHLTGYDRVMIYRFDADWHGEVIAEDRRTDLEAFLGLHYPASDIPPQARRLYLINSPRVIVDIDHTPSPLLPAVDPVNGQPLDLSRSLLRSISPVHLEYLRNMGVQATLTVSLVRDGQLWGLIACHHYAPNPVSGVVRRIAAWMALDLANEIALADEVRARRYATHLKQSRDHILAAMRQGVRLPGLLRGPQLADLLGVVGADGAALIRAAEVTTGGVTPDPRRILAIVAGLSARHPPGPLQLFATDCISEHLPETADLGATAAGVVLFPLGSAHSLTLIWFRGEQLRQVSWGGNPDKAVEMTPDGRLTPRRSFAAWTRLVALRSPRWSPVELESARELGVLIDIEWRRVAEDALRASEEALKVSLAELQRHDAQMVALNQMNGLLLSCDTHAEAYAVIAHGAALLFAPYAGGLAVNNGSPTELHRVAAWGDPERLAPGFLLRDCWALRRGQPHEVDPSREEPDCRHFPGPAPTSYVCVPLNVRGTTLGLLHIGADEALSAVQFRELRTLAVTVGESIKLALSNLRLREALRGDNP